MWKVLLTLSVILISLASSAASEAECYKKMPIAVSFSEEQIASMMMECSNLFLEGQFRYMRTSMSKHRQSAFAQGLDSPDIMNASKKAEKLMLYSLCEQNSHLVERWMKECKKH